MGPGRDERVGFAHTADGHRLAVTEIQVEGAPPETSRPVLLVHGFGQNRLAFSRGPLPEALAARGARVFLGELRGHGLSREVDPEASSSATWGLEALLRHDLPALVGHVLTRTKADRLHYMGHSMGGILGYAALADDPPFASLTGWAAPLRLGAGRPDVRVAALLPPLLARTRPRSVRMDTFLGALARPLATPDLAAPLRGLQRVVGLSNPAQAAPADLEAILGCADPESARVFEQLAALAWMRRPRIVGVELLAAVQAWPRPVAAVVGAHDVFAGPKTVAAIEGPGHAGRRRRIVVEGGRHVDVTMGHHVPVTVSDLWRFLSVDSGAEGE